MTRSGKECQYSVALGNVLPCPLCHNNNEIRAEENSLLSLHFRNASLKEHLWIAVSKTNSSTEIGKKLTLWSKPKTNHVPIAESWSNPKVLLAGGKSLNNTISGPESWHEILFNHFPPSATNIELKINQKHNVSSCHKGIPILLIRLSDWNFRKHWGKRRGVGEKDDGRWRRNSSENFG